MERKDERMLVVGVGVGVGRGVAETEVAITICGGKSEVLHVLELFCMKTISRALATISRLGHPSWSRSTWKW